MTRPMVRRDAEALASDQAISPGASPTEPDWHMLRKGRDASRGLER